MILFAFVFHYYFAWKLWRFVAITSTGIVGAFNNCEIISHNRSNPYSGINLQQFLPILLFLSRIKFLIEKIILDLLSVFVNSIRFNTRYVVSLLCNSQCLTSVTEYTYYVWLYFIIIKRRGVVEENPGSQYNSCQRFSVFYWNLNSICAHNFIKLALLLVVSQKRFWVVVFYLMMLIWIFQDII